jgi:capsular exopolysaccharide synthesis family protein
MEAKDQTVDSQPIQDPAGQGNLDEVITTIMRGKWVIAASYLIVVSLTLLYTLLMNPVYEATSMVLVDERGRSNHPPFLDITGAGTSTKITNELETLKSRATTEAVAQALLDKCYLDVSSQEMIPVIRRVVDGEQQDVKDNLRTVSKRLQKLVEFTPIKESDIIRITARSSDSTEAALIANTFARVYAERNMSASRTKSRSVREFLQSQVQSKHEGLDSTEQALESYMNRSGVVSLDAEANKLVDQLSQLEATRDGIEVDITARTKTLNSLKQELALQEPNVARAIGESNDTYIRMLQEQMARLEVQRDVVIAQNPELADQQIYSEKLKEIDSQIASLKNNLKERTKTFLGSLIPGDRSTTSEGGTAGFLAEVKQRIIEQQVELDGLVARKSALNNVITQYESQFNKIPQKSIELAKLQRARLSSEKLYLLVEEKFNEAAITETSEFGYVSIMDHAEVPNEPVLPRIGLNLILGSILGLVIGIVIVFVRSHMDDRIQTPEDLKKRGISPMATIPRVPVPRSKNGTKGGYAGEERSPFDQRLITYFSPLSSFSEGFRHLRTGVRFSLSDAPVRTAMISSPSPREGKSTTVCNLAISFAQGENRVLLIDADLRRPTIHSLFGLDKGPGVTDVVFGKRVFEDVVNTDVVEKLDILTCGTPPPNPAEVLGSVRMWDFIERIRPSYDIILFDTPPMLAVTDGALVARNVDAVFLVISAGWTGISSMERATEILRSVGKKAAGIVLNNFDIQRAYGGYYNRRSRDQHTYGYGYTTNENGELKRERQRR